MRMHWTRFLLSLLGLPLLISMIALPGSAQAGSPQVQSTGNVADVQRIQTTIRDYKTSIDNLDLDLARKIWSAGPEVTLIHPRGTEHGLDQVLQNFYGNIMGTLAKRELLPDAADVHVYNDTAWSEFTWTFHATMKNGGPQITTKGRETQIYHKEKGAWRIVHVHYSGMPAT